MRSPVRLLCLALLPLAVACNGKGSSPTSPSPSSTPPATTRIITVSGNLAFGDVAVGSQRDLSFTIANTGTTTLTVSGMSVSGGLASHLAASWTSGQIAPGATQPVTVTFQPTSAGNYSGVLTVNADQTSGTNSLAISGNATAPSFQGTWSGRYIVERCDGTGSVQDYFCSSRGSYPPGTDLPMTLSLTQAGTSVSGTLSLGQVTGVVFGTVVDSGTLVLQGTVRSGQTSGTLSGWSTTVSGSTMTGTFSYDAAFTGIPGVAVVRARLSGVTRR